MFLGLPWTIDTVAGSSTRCLLSGAWALVVGKNEMHLLHIGCGAKRKDQTLPALQSDDCQDVRLDIDASVAPAEIIGTMRHILAAVRSCRAAIR